MEKRHLDRRLAQMEAEGIKFRTGVDVGVDLTVADLRRRHDVILLTIGATAARDLPVPGRDLPGVHQAMEYLPLANQVQRGRRVPESPDPRRGQARRHHRRRRHRRRLPGHRAPPGRGQRHPARDPADRPPATRPDATPWPTYPMTYRVTSAHEEGGERVYSVNTKEFRADDSGRLRALRLVDVEMVDGRFVEVEGTERELPADLVFLAMGFVGPEQGRWSSSSASPRRAGQRRPRRALRLQRPRGVRRRGHRSGPEPDRLGHRRGPVCAAAVDTHLMGSTALPAPIPPTARPLVV